MEDSRIQFIFCFECNKESETDKRYVMDLIKFYYHDKPNVYPIFMGGIGNFKSARVVSEIKNHRKFLALQDPKIVVKVIYFVDTDSELDKLDKVTEKRLFTIKAFCRENNFELVLFVKEVEDVFQVKTTKKYKVKSSKMFLQNKNRYHSIKRSNLYKSRPIRTGESNILCVLDKYLS